VKMLGRRGILAPRLQPDKNVGPTEAQKGCKMNRKKSIKLFDRAMASIPGGVNSPVRAFGAVGGVPPFIARGEGPYLFDADGNRYIDYVMSWGPLILGHAHPDVIEAIERAARKGASFGAPTEGEILLAEMVKEAFPSVEKVRLVSSGTEAAMSALRLARGHTGRDKIIKFDGGYHGHSDGLLVKAGSGAATFGVPSSPGVPTDYARNTITVPYNDLDAVRSVTKKYSGEIAAIIVEPVAGNMGVVAPASGFLEGLRSVCDDIGAVLIFDEVITGFRIAKGGAQEKYGIRADITCLGKILGGGMPLGAYGGRAEIMNKISPQGPVYQAGTLSGNPVAVAAGIATLKAISKRGFYKALESKAQKLEVALAAAAKSSRVNITINRVGSMMTAFFSGSPVRNYADAASSDTALFKKWFHAMLDRGIYLAPSAFEAAFLSASHEDSHIEITVSAAREVFGEVKSL